MTWTRFLMGMLLLLVIVTVIGVYTGGLDTLGTYIPNIPGGP